jgi:hypothetical protein
MRTTLKALTIVVVLLLPATALAQASLTGTVRDSAGGVLPGVTVEAASPALIEKVRTAVTDDTGQYRIIDLRPGTYVLTFTLSGFNSTKRENIELTGSQTLTSPIEMRVGGVTELTFLRRADRSWSSVLAGRQHLGAAGSAGRRRAAQCHPWTPGRQQRRGAVADDDVLQRELEHDQLDDGGRRRPHERQRLYGGGGA